jgi:hypothetical protein
MVCMMGWMSRLWTRRSAAARPGDRRRAAISVTPLEDRRLLYFASTLVATPSVLFPPTGRFVPVVISGSFTELNHPPQKRQLGAFQVIDEYRRIEPSGPVALTFQGQNKFTFSFTLNLQASRSLNTPPGRRYYITVAALDSDGWSGKTVAVWVPHNLAQLLQAELNRSRHPRRTVRAAHRAPATHVGLAHPQTPAKSGPRSTG